MLPGDSGLSKAMDALSRLPEKPNSSVVVVPVNGVGTARDQGERNDVASSWLESTVQSDTPDIVSAADNPGLFVLAATLAFHRRHPVKKSPEPQILPMLLASLTSSNN